MEKLEISTPFCILQHFNTFVDRMYQKVYLSPITKKADFLLVTLAEGAYTILYNHYNTQGIDGI